MSVFTKKSRFICVLGLSMFVLSACGGDTETVYEERPPETIYQQATDALEADDYEVALELFDEVERQHPYSSWARRAVLQERRICGPARYPQS